MTCSLRLAYPGALYHITTRGNARQAIYTDDQEPRIRDIPGPYWFFFYSFDCNEPIHIHVRREKRTCKFWLDPIQLAVNHGFTAGHELQRNVLS